MLSFVCTFVCARTQAPEEEREVPVRENVPDSDDEGEQTWPSEAEIADAQKMFKRRRSKHKVPEGVCSSAPAWGSWFQLFNMDVGGEVIKWAQFSQTSYAFCCPQVSCLDLV